MYLTMSHETWLDETRHLIYKREPLLVGIDKSLFILDQCRGYYGYAVAVKKAMEAYLSEKGEANTKDPRDYRNSRRAFTKLFDQLDYFQRLVVAATDKFKSNPTEFLMNHMLVCDTGTYQSMLRYPGGAGQFDEDCKKIVKFILVPLAPGMVELNLVTDEQAKQAGTSCEARMFGYKYQISSGSEAAYCEVSPEERASVIFTVGLSGCTIVAVARNGMLRLYHEPTRSPAATETPKAIKKALALQANLERYPGKTLVRASPDGEQGLGSAVIVKADSKWHICIQSHASNREKWELQTKLDSQDGSKPAKSNFAPLFRGGQILKIVTIPNSLELLD
jgi:hypothetical protein